jgi:hypothetical protein
VHLYKHCIINDLWVPDWIPIAISIKYAQVGQTQTPHKQFRSPVHIKAAFAILMCTDLWESDICGLLANFRGQ